VTMQFADQGKWDDTVMTPFRRSRTTSMARSASLRQVSRINWRTRQNAR
jgi:hypothetical protein